MLPETGWSEDNLYSFKPGYYVLSISSNFPWHEEYRAGLERYALKRINEQRGKDPRWQRPLEVHVHWKSSGEVYRNILYSDLSGPRR